MKQVLKFMLILLILALISPLLAQEEVKEEVAVKWWVLPLFAVDSRDSSIGDLDKKDIELFMDGRKVEDFIIYRRFFSVTQEVLEPQKKGQAVEKQPPSPPIAPRGSKFLAANASDSGSGRHF